MRDRFHHACVERERAADDVLAVARRTGSDELRSGEGAVKVLEDRQHDGNRIACIRLIACVEDVAVRVRDHRFDRGRTGVDAERGFKRTVGNGCVGTDGGARVPFGKTLVFGFGSEKRQAGAVIAAAAVIAQRVGQFAKTVRAVLVGQSRAQRHIIQRVFRTDARRIQCFVKAFAKLAQKGQRSAEIYDFALQRTSLRQSRDRLVDDRAENARTNVVFGSALIDERLNIAFGEYTAARRYGISLLAGSGKKVHFVERDVEQRGHLVDEGTGPARAGAVHPHFCVLTQKQDFCVLAPQFDDDVAVGQKMPDRCPRGVDLLYEGQPERVRDAHTRRAGYDRVTVLFLREGGCDFAQHCRCAFRYARKMAAIVLVQQLAALVEDHALERGRTNIQIDSDHNAATISFCLGPSFAQNRQKTHRSVQKKFSHHYINIKL